MYSPPTGGVLSSTEAQTIASLWVHDFELLVNSDQEAAVCLAADCCLRDLLVFSPTFRMLEGREKIGLHLAANSKRPKFFSFTIMPGVTIKAIAANLHLIQGRVNFEDASVICTTIFTLAFRGDCSWKCWALFMVVNGLKRETPRTNVGAQIDTLVIGAGQAGLSIAAQLQHMDHSVCVVEKNNRVGAPWRDRYETLHINTPKDFSHLPFFPFPDDWPMFPSGTMVADHLERYPQVLGLVVRTGTEVLRTDYNEHSKTWTVWLRRMDTEFTLTSSHLVVATGVDNLGGLKPNLPKVSGLEDFQGTILHSTAVRSVHQWIGRRVVVFGAASSGHDISMALLNHGAAEVTMIQRAPTAVISREVLLKSFPDLYTGENKPPIDVADLLYLAFPTPISKVLRSAMMKELVLVDEALHLNLRKSGFQLPTGKSDFIERLTVRRGGYYIDNGCCELILNGKVQVRQYDEIESVVADGISFIDGRRLNADAIVLATGFQSDSKPAAFLNNSVYEKTGNIRGINEEGEAVGLWCPSGHDHLWFAGGDLFNCRFYSRLLALQILQAK
ncbi:hypothetical protein B0H19DRAFT_1105243 [Mycena capillaripes]|nr:hypothetical protein B0H19DRAFT_1105243 [Mycena capillaripes]